MSQLDTSALENDFPRSLIASQLISEARKAKKGVPTKLDLITALTLLTIEDTIQGSSSLTITLTDPNLVITTSGFLDPNADGRLDRLQLNYPDGSDYWWMLSSVNVTSRDVVELVFMERVAVWLQQFRGPYKASRASMTRAEFIKSLVDKTKQNIDFHSSELKTQQPIEITPPNDPGKTVKGKVTKTKTAAQKNKQPGMPDVLQPKIDGAFLTKEQVANANLVMTTANGVTKNKRPILAVLEACIVEGPRFSNPVGGDATSSGILQILNGTVAERRDIPRVIAGFLNGTIPPYLGREGGGGAVGIAARNPTWTPGEIAQKLQISAYPKRYDAVQADAELIATAWGYGSLTPGGLAAKTKSNYNFQVGNSANPHETYWDAIQRLATEVKWDFFVDGSDVYYDSETALILQKPILYLERDHPGVVDWSYSWDSRHICTEMTLRIVCDPDAFHAGEVVQLGSSFGSAGTGSNNLHPGRWLISATSRPSNSFISELTLKQPTFPGPEPATQSTDVPDAGVGDNTAAGKVYAKAAEIDAQNLAYVYGGGHGTWADAKTAKGLDCSSSVSLALQAGGFMAGLSGPQVSGWFETWGDSGKGKHMTVWCSTDHVWIEFYGRKAKRFDTSPHDAGPSGPHLRYTNRTDQDRFIARRFPGDV
jgi:hypothetical protein